ncbi:hypothetical protein C8T65DRAFT_771143 [Cerioporus squamosus]|nr:hypothetical protein C8T65DRAFT_771143 [Cerioporus squamosus]
MSAYIPFGKAVSLAHIQDLSLAIVGDHTAQLIPDFFAAIRRQCSPTSLHRLPVNPDGFPRVDNARRSSAVIRSTDLRPLLEFFLMEDFDLAMECHHAYDDAFVLDMTKAWPHLRTFYLSSEDYCVHDTLPTLTALAHLAVHGGPNLTEFGLRFDAVGWIHGPQSNSTGPPDRFYGELQGRASTSSVSSLFAGISQISWPENVALFLARVFPALDYIMLGEFDDDAQREHWEEVQRNLPMFARIRDDERLRMQQERRVSGGEGDEASEMQSYNDSGAMMTVDTDMA